MASPITSLPLVDKAGQKATLPSGKVVALYFSAHWCPPCRGFTPLLKKFYETLKASGNDSLEIIFVSGDKTEAEMQDYFRTEHGDWLAVDFNAKERNDLSSRYDVKGIPSLIVVDSKGEVVSKDLVPVVAKAQDSGSAVALLQQWMKDAGDWRETAGQALGGSNANDAAAMRAARLARLGGGPPVPAAAPAAAPPAAAPPAAAPPAAAPAAAAPAAAALPAEAPPAEALPSADAAKIETIQDMGFSKEQAVQALEAGGGNVETALNMLLG